MKPILQFLALPPLLLAGMAAHAIRWSWAAWWAARREERRNCFEEVRDECLSAQNAALASRELEIHHRANGYRIVKDWAIRKLSTATEAAQPEPEGTGT